MGGTVTVQRYSRDEKAANRKSFQAAAKAALLYTAPVIVAGAVYNKGGVPFGTPPPKLCR